MKKPIFLPVWCTTMTELDNNPKINMAQLVQKQKITYCYIVAIINELEKNQWITTQKKGRTRTIKLTKKGKQIAQTLKKLQQQTQKK